MSGLSRHCHESSPQSLQRSDFECGPIFASLESGSAEPVALPSTEASRVSGVRVLPSRSSVERPDHSFRSLGYWTPHWRSAVSYSTARSSCDCEAARPAAVDSVAGASGFGSWADLQAPTPRAATSATARAADAPIRILLMLPVLMVMAVPFLAAVYVMARKAGGKPKWRKNWGGFGPKMRSQIVRCHMWEGGVPRAAEGGTVSGFPKNRMSCFYRLT